jgi:hypothetical protein
LPAPAIDASNAAYVSGSSSITLAIGRIDRLSTPWFCAFGAMPSYSRRPLRRVKLVLADSAVKLFGQPNRGIEVSMTLGERRAFVAGYRAALRRARGELDGMAQRLDDELCRIDDEQRAAREQVTQRVDAEIAGLVDEMKGMRDDYRRLKAIEEAVAVERDFDAPLN